MDSTITSISKDFVKQNPFRSRSTVICLGCLGTLIVIDVMAMKSGYMNVEFLSMSLLVLREMISASLNHQLNSDKNVSKTP